MKKIVEYIDGSTKKTRWGYITEPTYKTIQAFKAQEAQDAIITVYLADGTTGSANIADLLIVEPFASEEEEAKGSLLMESSDE